MAPDADGQHALALCNRLCLLSVARGWATEVMSSTASDADVSTLLAHFGLERWWRSEISAESRAYLEALYGSLHFEPRSALDLHRPELSATAFLTSLTVWLSPNDRELAQAILSQAESMQSTAPVLDRHFLFSRMVEFYNNDYDAEHTWDESLIRACEAQIAISTCAIRLFRDQHTLTSSDSPQPRREGRRPFLPPKHLGYERLCRIREHQGAYEEAMCLARRAENEGWAGPWGQLIARCRRKLVKAEDV